MTVPGHPPPLDVDLVDAMRRVAVGVPAFLGRWVLGDVTVDEVLAVAGWFEDAATALRGQAAIEGDPGA